MIPFMIIVMTLPMAILWVVISIQDGPAVATKVIVISLAVLLAIMGWIHLVSWALASL